jgi:hypothetical protein
MRGGNVEIQELELGTRALGVPERVGIETVEDLCRLTAEQVRNLGNCGKKTLREIEGALRGLSLSLRCEPVDEGRLLFGFGTHKRFNAGLSESGQNSRILVRYTLRESDRIQGLLQALVIQLPKRTHPLLRGTRRTRKSCRRSMRQYWNGTLGRNTTVLEGNTYLAELLRHAEEFKQRPQSECHRTTARHWYGW